MYAITGITGHVGGATVRALRAVGERVRAVTRGPGGADFMDRRALAAAFAGCDGAFVLLPTDPALDDAGHRRMADSIAAAVEASGVPHVVALSSVGADQPDGTGPIRWLHHLENGLRATGARVTALRSPHFQEKVSAVLGAAAGGIYPVFGSADVPTPMVATRDVGAVVARALVSPPAASEVVDLAAPRYTEREVAAALGAVLGRALSLVTVPRAGWADALRGAGVPPTLVGELVALYDAEERGSLRPCGDRMVSCATPLAETLRTVVGVPA
ncbi:NmrA family NAD(P)-binding protein [Asanoa sp. WMMD1127]|uniref:NmrA family NAD(P)-binding protein n=1 Tax=Asanoa sp. WMMD1127 TaxID=3016107 RepID=UPI00241655F1|nr:NmrA family NAD(P)-binding protein [Asanoa sp. WMMD1127]MDG4825873.1 NmrA family NAD(P)-binding protein [Asanoa sp. WMMD1127]